MIAARIYNGETAEQIGISADNYRQRQDALDRYLATTGGVFDQAGYAVWLQRDATGDRGEDWSPDQPSRGLGDTVAKITQHTGLVKIARAYTKVTGRDCGCGRRQKKLNKLLPYKTERV